MKVVKRCVKSIPKAYRTFKTKINSKIISIRRRRRERYLTRLQKNNIPGWKKPRMRKTSGNIIIKKQ